MLKNNKSKFAFSQIDKDPSNFILHKNGIEFKGCLYLKDFKTVCKGKISGKIEHFCDACFEPIMLNINEDIDLILSDGISKDNQTLDIFEFFNGFIDIEEILDSELEAFKSDYHYCNDCKNL